MSESVECGEGWVLTHSFSLFLLSLPLMRGTVIRRAPTILQDDSFYTRISNFVQSSSLSAASPVVKRNTSRTEVRLISRTTNRVSARFFLSPLCQDVLQYQKPRTEVGFGFSTLQKCAEDATCVAPRIPQLQTHHNIHPCVGLFRPLE